MSRDGSWGDHLILGAASNLYELIIESREDYEITLLAPDKKTERTALLGHIGEFTMFLC